MGGFSPSLMEDSMALRTVRAGEVDDDVIDVLTQVVTLLTEMKTDWAALLAKLDADAGVTDTNYAATLALAAATPDTLRQVF
jgi:hypothetical protein